MLQHRSAHAKMVHLGCMSAERVAGSTHPSTQAQRTHRCGCAPTSCLWGLGHRHPRLPLQRPRGPARQPSCLYPIARAIARAAHHYTLVRRGRGLSQVTPRAMRHPPTACLDCWACLLAHCPAPPRCLLARCPAPPRCRVWAFVSPHAWGRKRRTKRRMIRPCWPMCAPCRHHRQGSSCLGIIIGVRPVAAIRTRFGGPGFF